MDSRADAVYCAAFSPDGRFPITGSEDATAHVHACEVCGSVEDQLTVSASRVTRELMSAERERYLQ